MRGPVRVLVACLMMAAAMSWASAVGATDDDAGAADPPAIEAIDDRVCELPAGADMAEIGPAVALVGDIHPDLLWLEDDLVQQMLQNASRAIEHHGDHFAGSFVDYRTQTLVILRAAGAERDGSAEADVQAAVDRAPADLAVFEAEQDRIDMAALDEAEQAILEAESEVLPKPEQRPELQIVVVEACRPHQHLPAVADAIVAQHAGRSPMLVGVDPVTATVQVRLDPGLAATAAVAADIRAQFGADVTIVEGPVPQRTVGGRNSDDRPHLGGARINNNCSTGFSVDRDGGRWLTSAGHCFTGDWQSAYSGSEYVGVSRYRSFPDPDVTLIGSGFETYRRSIYVDPCCPSVRLVTAKGGNWVGQSICTSGSFSTARCGGIVQNPLNNQFCDASGCTNNLRLAIRANDATIAQPGDSGGPVYNRLSSNRARIRGLIVGGNAFAPYDEVLFHSVATVEAQTDSTVATACCDNDSW